MRVENIRAYNFERALAGMRNPLESWSQSDSIYGIATNEEFEKICDEHEKKFPTETFEENCRLRDWIYENGILHEDEHCLEYALLGPKDLALAKKLVLAGSPSHSKFMRQIFVSMDITSSLFHWKEFDTFKVATVANSTSTMHKLSTTPITRDRFLFDEENEDLLIYPNHHGGYYVRDFIDGTIEDLEQLRLIYLQTKDLRYWRALIQMLPDGWLQKRTWTANYEVLRNIYFTRRNHKLIEWRNFCSIIESLPYARDLVCLEAHTND